MAFNKKLKKQHQSSRTNLRTILFFIVLFTIPVIFILHNTFTNCLCAGSVNSVSKPWSGDLRKAEFAWNRLSFAENQPPQEKLRIAVFSRKWPIETTPGGMERHAYTLHTTLASRGHDIHVFTSPVKENYSNVSQESKPSSPQIHFHEGEPDKWRPNKAWEQFEEESQHKLFDVVHSESVALPHNVAREVPNLAVTWHGIALESLQSKIYQDLIRKPDEQMSPTFNESLSAVIPTALKEIRFFGSYAHHIATSDSSGEMLRDVYQIPSKRVHVILNGVDEHGYGEDFALGREFRSKIGIPRNASLVLGAAGRLVKDKGHPLLFEAFAQIARNHPDVYLIVAGAGPWGNRYREIGSQVLVLGSLNSSQLKEFYNGIDVFVNPTLRPQGLDITLMEVMMSGTPLMASRFPSIKGSVVVEEEFGFMFAPNVESLSEALEAAVREGPQRMAERGKACRDYASTMFTATKMALAYERLFLCIENDSFCAYH